MASCVHLPRPLPAPPSLPPGCHSIPLRSLSSPGQPSSVQPVIATSRTWSWPGTLWVASASRSFASSDQGMNCSSGTRRNSPGTQEYRSSHPSTSHVRIKISLKLTVAAESVWITALMLVLIQVLVRILVLVLILVLMLVLGACTKYRYWYEY